MGSTAKDPNAMVRRNRRIGEVLRWFFRCPLCAPELGIGIVSYQARVVAYRAKTVRMECERCGLRFSFGLDDALGVLQREPDHPRARLALGLFNRHLYASTRGAGGGLGDGGPDAQAAGQGV